MSQRRLPVPDLRLSELLRRHDDRLGRMERLLLRDPKVVGSTLSQTFITALTQNITTIQNITNITNISNFITQIFTTGGGSGRLLRYTAFDARVWTPGDIGSIVLQELTKMLIVELVGPGGGGGNAPWFSAGNTAAGGGGGGGAYTLKVYDPAHSSASGYLAPTGGMTLYWKLGVPGVGGIAGDSEHNGTGGGDTKFDVGSDGSEGGSQLGPTVRAVAGGGGSGESYLTTPGGTRIVDGGASGAAEAADLDGTLVSIAGDHGGYGLVVSNSDGTVSKAAGGYGGASALGGRCQGGFDSGNDPPTGRTYGGGGGGAASSESGPSRPGGGGGPALIIVREYS